MTDRRQRRRRDPGEWIAAVFLAGLLVTSGVIGVVLLVLVVYSGWVNGGVRGVLIGLGACVVALGAVLGVAWWLLSAEDRADARRRGLH
jgi:high-affinity Fe2+/Pb2+ permease